jgi:hypothetical protein
MRSLDGSVHYWPKMMFIECMPVISGASAASLIVRKFVGNLLAGREASTNHPDLL